MYSAFFQSASGYSLTRIVFKVVKKKKTYTSVDSLLVLRTHYYIWLKKTLSETLAHKILKKKNQVIGVWKKVNQTGPQITLWPFKAITSTEIPQAIENLLNYHYKDQRPGHSCFKVPFNIIIKEETETERKRDGNENGHVSDHFVVVFVRRSSRCNRQ